MSRRDVDQQISDLAAGDRLEVLDDGIDVQARDEWRRRLDNQSTPGGRTLAGCEPPARSQSRSGDRVF